MLNGARIRRSRSEPVLHEILHGLWRLPKGQHDRESAGAPSHQIVRHPPPVARGHTAVVALHAIDLHPRADGVHPRAPRVGREVHERSGLEEDVHVARRPAAQPDLPRVTPRLRLRLRVRARVRATVRATVRVRARARVRARVRVRLELGVCDGLRLRGGSPMLASTASGGVKVSTAEEPRPSMKTSGPSAAGSRCGSSCRQSKGIAMGACTCAHVVAWVHAHVRNRTNALSTLHTCTCMHMRTRAWKNELSRMLTVTSRTGPRAKAPHEAILCASSPMAGGSCVASKPSP